MCKYAELAYGKCTLTKENCPYVYYCDKILAYKESKAMPDVCPVSESYQRPKGYYKVLFERHGNLYVEINQYTEIIKNTYNYIPKYVKLTKLKNGGWRIKEAIE